MTLVTPVIQPAGPSAPYSLSEPIHRERAPTATNAMLLRALFGPRESVMHSYGRLRRGGSGADLAPGSHPHVAVNANQTGRHHAGCELPWPTPPGPRRHCGPIRLSVSVVLAAQ